ncbi:MAG: peptidase, partial [Bacteroidetes bacterium]
MKKLLYVLALFAVTFATAQEFSETVGSYLNNNRSVLGLQSQDVAEFSINSNSYSKSMDLDNVYVNQMHQGIEIFNSTSSFAIKNGAVVHANLRFTENVEQKVNTTTPSNTAITAISQAASTLGIQGSTNLELLETVGANSFIFSNGNISLENIPVKLVYQSTESNTLRLAWDLSIALLDGSHYYSLRVDAVTGALIDTIDWTVSCNFGEAPHSHENKSNGQSILFPETAAMSFSAVSGPEYRVFPIPAESPNHGPDVLLSDPANPVASPFGWHDTDGVAGAEFTVTRGNNVLAQDDIDGNNGTGASPDGGADLHFDFPFDLTTQPVDYLDAATTNLFYMNNIMHDVYYQYGFDEAAGNFQENNYGNSGNGSDSVNADAQDGSGTNNANFGTPPDGGNPRMQMFLWSGGSGPTDLLDINNGPLAGSYSGVPATFGGSLVGFNLTEDLVLVEDDDAGTSTDPNDACDVITNGAALSGKIAVIRRGACEFGVKALAAQNEGAVAVIMVNNVAGAPIPMAGGAVGGSVTIPLFMVSNVDGEAIIAELSMAVVNGTINGTTITPDIDGSLDNGIIAHEYGHGISNRLTGGPNNTGCLNNQEQMGEGWSDWLGMMITIEPGDQGADGRGIGTFALGQPITGGGIRPFPYSTDLSVNPHTYDDIKTAAVPHGVGSVWAAMIWDMTWDLIDQYGFDPDIYNGTGGNNIAIQLVLDGMKLQPCNPGFVTGRDAILMADQLNNAGANQCLIWEAFARRGLGLSAV